MKLSELDKWKKKLRMIETTLFELRCYFNDQIESDPANAGEEKVDSWPHA